MKRYFMIAVESEETEERLIAALRGSFAMDPGDGELVRGEVTEVVRVPTPFAQDISR